MRATGGGRSVTVHREESSECQAFSQRLNELILRRDEGCVYRKNTQCINIVSGMRKVLGPKINRERERDGEKEIGNHLNEIRQKSKYTSMNLNLDGEKRIK